MNSKFTLGAAAALTAAGIIGFATFGMAENDKSAPTDNVASTVPADRQMTIWRDPSCGCCDAYADYAEENGYHVTRIDDRDFDKRSVEVGVPEQGLGCHLAEVDGYYVSGLVPVEIIQPRCHRDHAARYAPERARHGRQERHAQNLCFR